MLYQLVAAPAEVLGASLLHEALPLGAPEQLVYLAAGDCTTISGRSDQKEFAATAACLEELGVSAEAQQQVWTLLAATLQVGSARPSTTYP